MCFSLEKSETISLLSSAKKKINYVLKFIINKLVYKLYFIFEYLFYIIPIFFLLKK
jgi:hypothetical protein